MGIYIKGMEMPKDCGSCQFCHTEGFTSWCCPTGREDILIDAIPDWCPLTEVPEPHGRLIDADDVNNHVMGFVDLRDCPTIIESEVGE